MVVLLIVLVFAFVGNLLTRFLRGGKVWKIKIPNFLMCIKIPILVGTMVFAMIGRNITHWT